jgi:hypothetical protein
MKKTLNVIAVILGVVFVVVAFIYWLTPASSLPGFFPGYDALLAARHFKHGIAAFIVGLVFFAFAWFNSAKKVS